MPICSIAGAGDYTLSELSVDSWRETRYHSAPILCFSLRKHSGIWSKCSAQVSLTLRKS